MDARASSFLSSPGFQLLHQASSSASGFIFSMTPPGNLWRRFPRANGRLLISRYAILNSPISKVSNSPNQVKNSSEILMLFFDGCYPGLMNAGYSGFDILIHVCILLRLCFLFLTCVGRPTRIAPVGVPQYPELPLEWEILYMV